MFNAPAVSESGSSELVIVLMCLILVKCVMLHVVVFYLMVFLH